MGVVQDQKLPEKFQAFFYKGLQLWTKAKLQQGLEVVVKDLVQKERNLLRAPVQDHTINYLQDFFKGTLSFFRAFELR